MGQISGIVSIMDHQSLVCRFYIRNPITLHNLSMVIQEFLSFFLRCAKYLSNKSEWHWLTSFRMVSISLCELHFIIFLIQAGDGPMYLSTLVTQKCPDFTVLQSPRRKLHICTIYTKRVCSRISKQLVICIYNCGTMVWEIPDLALSSQNSLCRWHIYQNLSA